MSVVHITEATRWLTLLRQGTDRYEACLGYLRAEVQKGGFSLEEIGTSEEELQGFRRR